MGVFLGLCSIFCEIEHIAKSTVGGLSSVSCASVWVGRLHLLFDVTLARLEANFIFGVSLSDVVVVTLWMGRLYLLFDVTLARLETNFFDVTLARLETNFFGLSLSDVVVVTLRHWLSLCLARLERTFLLGLSHSDVVVVTLRYW
jgi:hypothetical protein